MASRGELSTKLLKLLLLGNSTVGKTSLMLRFCEDSFTLNFSPTIGVDYKFKTIEHSGNRVKLQIWDTAGQERFKAITTRYYRMAAGILMVYDVTDRTSFAAVENWIKSIHQHGDPSCQVVLVANKVDCAQERVVSTEEGTACAAKYGVPFFESSARTGENVQQAFLQLAAAALGSSALFADDDDGTVDPVIMGGGGILGHGGGSCPC